MSKRWLWRISSSSDKKSCGFDTDMETEDSVEDDGSEFVAQADKLASMIVRITIWNRFIRHNLHFVYSNRSFCLVNVVHTVFVTAFLKKVQNLVSFGRFNKKSVHTFVNNYKRVGKNSAN